MKITLSKGGGSRRCPLSDSAKVAFPGINGLYGKKPLANTRIATGIRRFEKMRKILRDIVGFNQNL